MATYIKDKINALLTKPYIAIFTLLLATLFSTVDRNMGFFFGLFVVFLILRKNKYDWSLVGFGKVPLIKSVLGGLLIAVLTFLVIDIGIQPHLEIYLGAIDFSSFDEIRGDPINYLIMTIVVWVFAAFGEEILFQGFYMKHIAEYFGGAKYSWLFSGLFISVYFGISHNYQGLAGMIAVGLAGLIHAVIFMKKRDHLLMLVLAHGCYDMIGLTLIYHSKEQLILDWFR